MCKLIPHLSRPQGKGIIRQYHCEEVYEQFPRLLHFYFQFMQASVHKNTGIDVMLPIGNGSHLRDGSVSSLCEILYYIIMYNSFSVV